MILSALSALVVFLTVFIALYLALNFFERGRLAVNPVLVAGLMLPICAGVLLAEFWSWLAYQGLLRRPPRLALIALVAVVTFLGLRYSLGLSRLRCAAYAALALAAIGLGLMIWANLPVALRHALL